MSDITNILPWCFFLGGSPSGNSTNNRLPIPRRKIADNLNFSFRIYFWPKFGVSLILGRIFQSRLLQFDYSHNRTRSQDHFASKTDSMSLLILSRWNNSIPRPSCDGNCWIFNAVWHTTFRRGEGGERSTQIHFSDDDTPNVAQHSLTPS